MKCQDSQSSRVELQSPGKNGSCPEVRTNRTVSHNMLTEKEISRDLRREYFLSKYFLEQEAVSWVASCHPPPWFKGAFFLQDLQDASLLEAWQQPEGVSLASLEDVRDLPDKHITSPERDRFQIAESETTLKRADIQWWWEAIKTRFSSKHRCQLMEQSQGSQSTNDSSNPLWDR